MPTPNNEHNPRVEAYVRNQMNADEECDFEAEYLADPSLQGEVDIALQLQRGLALTDKDPGPQAAQSVSKASTDQSTNVTQPTPKKPGGWMRYFAVPQTLCGAVAATLVLSPFLLQGPALTQLAPNADTAVYVVKAVQVRSGNENTAHLIELGDKNQRLVLGIQVPSTMGVPQGYQLSLIDDSGTLWWQSPEVFADHESVVYVDLPADSLRGREYVYMLQWQNGGNESLEGRIRVR